MKTSNKERILAESILLFNIAGAASTSTNHICDRLKVSPGNLYFHFKNKEQINHALFLQMCNETYSLWKKALADEEVLPPREFVQFSLEICWKYRFFHREMYHLRRQDILLNQEWHRHLNKTRKFMRGMYAKWVRNHFMKSIRDPEAMRMVGDIVLITASSFFQFYETIDKPATEKPLKMANKYLMYFLSPYFTADYEKSIKSN